MVQGDVTDVAIGAPHDPDIAPSSEQLHEGSAIDQEVVLPPTFESKSTKQHEFYTHDDLLSDEDNRGEYPTDEELETLRRVSGRVPWKAYTLAFVELCERFSYYGTTVVCE